jgi:hypothetical protein
MIKFIKIRSVGHVTHAVGIRSTNRVFVGKPERNRPLARPGLRWEDNIKVELKWMEVEGTDLFLSGSGYWQVASFCGDSKAPFRFHKMQRNLDSVTVSSSIGAVPRVVSWQFVVLASLTNTGTLTIYQLPTWCTDYYLFKKYYSPLHVSSLKVVGGCLKTPTNKLPPTVSSHSSCVPTGHQELS